VIRAEEATEGTEAHPAEDGELVELARAGDQDAFGELVRRHRARVFGMASKWVHDHHLAEDIVQDAFIKAFLHLGKLMNPERFVPWLSRIVRNQMLMKLRRGGPHAKESTFTYLRGPGETGSYGKWDNLDNILHMMRKSIPGNPDIDPEECLMRKDLIETLCSFLHCLNRRERHIFEAYFFQQLSPGEIAAMLDTTKSYVYKTISLSRNKIQREQLRGYVSRRMQMRRELGGSSARMLEKPLLLNEPKQSWHSVNQCFHHALKYTSKNQYSLSDIIGFTGHAHRLTIERFTVHASGPGFYDWETIFIRGLYNMGVNTRIIERSHFNPPIPELVADAVELIQSSIDRGVPALVWNLLNGEFALVYGYDDDRQRLYAVDTKQEGIVPYCSLGQGDFAELFVIAFADFFAVDDKNTVKQALAMIIDHANGGGKGDPGVVYGVQAYSTWIDLFQQRKVEPLGNAYSLQCIRESREYAVQFVQQLAMRGDWGPQFQEEAAKAVSIYASIAEVFERLCTMFPFPSGGDPGSDATAESAIRLLRQVQQFEQEGIQMMQNMLEAVHVHDSLSI